MAATVVFIWEDACSAVGLLSAMVRGERAQTLAEYSLLLTLIGVGVVVPTMLVFRTALAGAFASATDCMTRVTC
jgi:Flp pilus assembly pilin Flp